MELKPVLIMVWCAVLASYGAPSRAEHAVDDIEKKQLDEATANINSNRSRSQGPYLKRAYIYFGRGDYQQAYQDLTKALSLKGPNQSEAYFFRAQAAAGMANYNQSIQDFESSIKGGRADRWVFALKASTELAAHKEEDALKTIALGISKNGDVDCLLEARGQVHERQRRYGEAIKDYEKLTQRRRSDQKLWRKLAELHLNMGDKQKAIASLTKVIELTSENSGDYKRRGDLYAACGQSKLAVADYTQAIENEANFSSALYSRAAAYEKLGKLKEANLDRKAARRAESEL